MAWYERLRTRLHLIWLGFTMMPMAGADDDAAANNADADKDGDKDGDRSDDTSDDDKDGDKDGDVDKVDKDDDWQAKARKHERAAKRERKAREAAEQKLKDRETENQTEQEKALEKAREEGRTAALSEAEKERRSDRLEVAVTRLASKGVEVGEGDEAKVTKFADSEDALLRIERGIRRGDIDADDIYDSEGKVNTDALSEALGEILSANAHLAAGEGERPKPKGDADARKGDAAKSDLESMTPEDHAKRKYPANK